MNNPEESVIHISQDDAKEIEETYNGLLLSLKKTLDTKDAAEIRLTILGKLIKYIIETLSPQTDKPLLLYSSKIFDKHYIYAHSLNTCLLAIKIGMTLGIKGERLEKLGFLCLIHIRKDVGVPDKIVENIEPDEEMDEIIKLVDLYDALTHPPAYRHTVTTYDTLTSIIKSENYNPELIKILFEELSFYPKGTWVQLSTKEIGRVTEINKGQPLRPTVKIFLDWKGKVLKEEKITNLSENNLVFLTRPLSGEEIAKFNIT